jgi:CDP-glucose 4,6-dehydratase
VESLAIDPAFWSGRHVFLTGHTGFKGSWLALWLTKLGAHVTGYSLAPNTQPNHFDAIDLGSIVTSHIGDIRDLETLRSAMTAATPDVVFHLAAQPLVRESFANPIETYATNVMGTANVLESVRSCPTVKSVVVITTDKVYENKEWEWGYRENDRLGGFDPYSNSKACAELVTSSYTQSFFPPEEHATHGVGIATARAGNVFGGGDWAKDRLIPDLVRAYEAKVAPVIRYPGAVRPWQHVLEPLSGYLMLARALYEHGPRFGGAFNFGPRDTDVQTVKTICEILGGMLGDPQRWVLDDRVNPHEAGYLKLDISKAMAQLGWEPKTNLNQGLKLAGEWYKKFAKGAEAMELTLHDITAFEAISKHSQFDL